MQNNLIARWLHTLYVEVRSALNDYWHASLLCDLSEAPQSFWWLTDIACARKVIVFMAQITIAAARKAASAQLKSAGIPDAAASAKWLMHHVMKAEPKWAGKTLLTEQQDADFQLAVGRRLQREPVQYIIGEWDFDVCKSIICRPPVLIPRPETEDLVVIAQDYIDRQRDIRQSVGSKRPFHFLEVGSGSGALSVSLLARNPDIYGTAIDVSEEAYHLTQENAAKQSVASRLNVQRCDFRDFRVPNVAPIQKAAPPPVAKRPSDTALWAALDRPKPFAYDMLVSNPPYIDEKEYENDLEPEVRRFEDKRALIGGAPFGAGFTLQLLQACITHKWLAPCAAIMLETHFMHPALLSLLWDNDCPAITGADTEYNDMGRQHVLKTCNVSEERVTGLQAEYSTTIAALTLTHARADRHGKPRFIELQVVDEKLKEDATDVLAFAAEILVAV
jgi:release factor glutamine methyltransferase